MTTPRPCTWCGTIFTPRSPAAGFCGNAHRNAFHGALRTWAAGEFAAGRVTIEQLRDAAAAAVRG